MTCTCDESATFPGGCDHCIGSGRSEAMGRDIGPVARLRATARAMTPDQRVLIKKLAAVNRAWEAGAVEIPTELVGQRVKVRVGGETWTINFPSEDDQFELPGIQPGAPEVLQGWLDSLRLP